MQNVLQICVDDNGVHAFLEVKELLAVTLKSPVAKVPHMVVSVKKSPVSSH